MNSQPWHLPTLTEQQAKERLAVLISLNPNALLEYPEIRATLANAFGKPTLMCEAEVVVEDNGPELGTEAMEQ